MNIQNTVWCRQLSGGSRGKLPRPQMCAVHRNEIDWGPGHEKTYSSPVTLMTNDTFTFDAIVSLSGVIWTRVRFHVNKKRTANRARGAHLYVLNSLRINVSFRCEQGQPLIKARLP